MLRETKQYLLIGNSRWHWALDHKNNFKYLHTNPNPNKLRRLGKTLYKWAAVGDIPNDISLRPENRITIKDIPLNNLPEWIGIDRALGAWNATKKVRESGDLSTKILVADAGTVFSLTVIDENNSFKGGQLVPGLNLQIEAMSTGAKGLSSPGLIKAIPEMFPHKTDDAMIKGSIQSLIGTILEAKKYQDMSLWLCGGDSALLFEELKKHDLTINYAPNLVIEAMTNL